MGKWIPTRYLPPEDMDADDALCSALRKLLEAERDRIESCETDGDVRAARWRITAITREVLNLTADLTAKKPIPVTEPLDAPR